MNGSSSSQADKNGQDVEEETMTWTILLASTSRWTRPTLRRRPRRRGDSREQDGVESAIERGRARESAELSSDRIRDRTGRCSFCVLTWSQPGATEVSRRTRNFALPRQSCRRGARSLPGQVAAPSSCAKVDRISK